MFKIIIYTLKHQNNESGNVASTRIHEKNTNTLIANESSLSIGTPAEKKNTYI